MDDYTLDELDYKILQLIANDTRVSFLEVSRVCNVSGAAVHQRVQKMINNGIIVGSQFRLDLLKVGYQTTAYIRLQFAQECNSDKILEALKNISQIAECYSTMGQYQYMIKVYARNNNELFDIIESKIKPLGLISSDPLTVYSELFHRQISL